jgi:hypothetical protein
LPRCRPAREFTGNFLIGTIPIKNSVTDFGPYRGLAQKLVRTFFVPADGAPRKCDEGRFGQPRRAATRHHRMS